MKTTILAAAAMLAVSAGTAFAGGFTPHDGDVHPATTSLRPQHAGDPGAGRATQDSRIYAAQSQPHDAWQNNGLNGGGG